MMRVWGGVWGSLADMTCVQTLKGEVVGRDDRSEEREGGYIGGTYDQAGRKEGKGCLGSDLG